MLLKNYLILAVGVALTLILVNPFSDTPLYAQDDEVQMLRRKIVELESRINDLEALLSIHYNTGTKQSDEPYGWQNKMNWRKLELGMDESRVKTILGKPVKTIKGVRTLWYYPNFYCGYVSFDENGNLTGWNEP